MKRSLLRPISPLSLPALVIGLLLAAQTLMPAARLWHERTAHASLPAGDDRPSPTHHHDDESSCPTCQSIAFSRLADFTLPPVFIEFLTLRPEPVCMPQAMAPTQSPRLCAHAPRGPPARA